MSGIFALFDDSNRGELDSTLEHVRNFSLPGAAPHKIEYTHGEGWLAGRYHLDIFKHPPLSHHSNLTATVLTSGYRVGDFPAPVAEPYQSSGFDIPTIRKIGQWLEHGNEACFARLDGAWQVLFISPDKSRISIAVDRLGLQPLYYFHQPGMLACASEFRLLLCLIARPMSLDYEALLELCELGLVTADRTLFTEVRVFPAGTIADFDGEKLTCRQYWRPRFTHHNPAFDSGEAAKAITTALRRAVKQRLSLHPHPHPHPQAALSLSGGMDSRLLLAAAGGENLRPDSFTFGPDNSPEFAIAAAVAQTAGSQHREFQESPNQMAGIFATGVIKSGGMNNVLDFGGLASLPEIATTARLVVNGYGGNELLGFLAFDLLRFVLRRDREYFGRWLRAKLNPGWLEGEIEQLRRRLDVAPYLTADRVFAVLPTDESQSAITLGYHFFFEQKARRANLLGVTADNLQLEPLLPFCGNEVVDLCLVIPSPEKLLARFYRRMFKEQFPEYAAITYNRTGLPVEAQTARIMLHKFSRLGKRRPDTTWDVWLRGDLREYVGDLLLTGRPKLWDLWGAEFVQKIVADFLGERRPGARLVGQLLTVELFLRSFPLRTK